MSSEILEELREALREHYAVESEVGRGGMATVFLAEDLKHGRRVAIKVLSPELSSSIDSDRFKREIQIAARLSHPHILPVFDSGEANGLLYYVMPFVEGESLRGRLEARDAAVDRRRDQRSPARSRTRCRMRTRSASSIATSSPRTSSCTAVTRSSPTSASRA